MSESFLVNMRCAIDGQAFRVVFDKADRSRRWRIASVLHTGAVQTEASATAPAMSALEAGDLDWSGWHCPVCGIDDDRGFFLCGTCQEFICAAKTRAISPEINTYECHPGCEGAGRLTGEIASYQGTKKSSDLLDAPAPVIRLPGANAGELSQP